MSPDISFLVPFREDSSGTRTRTWRWLESYWRSHMPDVEIVIGRDDSTPYSKATAINDAAANSHGYILVVLDADSYVRPEVIRMCAERIEAASKPLWFLPHSRAYRMTREASDDLLAADPTGDPPFPSPDRKRGDIFEDYIERAPGFVQILSRRAFERAPYDRRFRGWGGEDGSFVRAVDTLYGAHTRLPDHVLHLWHERPGRGSSKTRRWDGQVEGALSYRTLSYRYRAANGNRIAMRELVQEGLDVQ